jgi:outer membrane protein assembly factor BamB
LCLVGSARADWPHLRGPNYDGVATERGLADAWPTDGPPRLWQRELGQGYSGFIVAQGKLFTQRQTLGGQFLLCLNPDTGETVWEYRYDWAWQPRGAYPGPYSSPTWHGGKLFYASTNGLVGCVDAQTGVPLWSLNVREKFKGKGIEFGYAATPLVEDDKVIVPVGGPDAALVALHVDDGRTLWTAGADPASYCPAMAITFQGKRGVVGYLQNAFVLVELATGKLLHREPLSNGYDEHSAWPIYREPHLLLTAPFRVSAVRYELSAEPTKTLLCKPQWTSRELCNDVVSSVLYEDHLYGFDLKQLQASAHRSSRGMFKCVDWTTGKTRWTTEEIGHASVLVADGKLLMLNDTGSLILARADPTAYHELARVQLFANEICWTPPTLWQGKLFLRSPSQAVCVYVGLPDQLDQSIVPLAPGQVTPSWRFDPAWLLTRERPFPNDAPTWEEMAWWFAASVLLVFGGAVLVTELVLRGAKRFVDRELSRSLLFFGFTVVFGFLGPNLFSSLVDRCLFTWPASLYAAFHAAVWACWWAERQPAQRRARWLARLAIVAFLLVGYAYYELCKNVGMFIAWSFLVGFPFALPLTFLAVWQQRRLVVAAWTLLAFAAFFWSCQGLFWWKTPS